MTYRSNLNRYTLLANLPITIDFNSGKRVLVKPPTLSELLNDLDFQNFYYLIQMTPEQYSQDLDALKFTVSTRYDTLIAILQIDLKTDLVIEYFQKHFINTTITKEGIFVGEDEISSEEYDVLYEVFLVTCGDKELDELPKEEKELTDLERKMIEKEKQIKKIKEQKEGATQVVTIDQTIQGILYEFPSVTLKDIFNMNMFTFLFYGDLVLIVAEESMNRTAAAQGLLKGYTHFTRRGEKE